MDSSQRRRWFFKYQKKHNAREQVFGDDMFQFAEFVLLEVPEKGIARIYFVETQKPAAGERQDREIGTFLLPGSFTVPSSAAEISAARFRELLGDPVRVRKW